VDQTRALVEFDNNKNMLTLSTCNTFGAKSERYVVEADYLDFL
jgi:sortase (surface protein transpeptidase)